MTAQPTKIASTSTPQQVPIIQTTRRVLTLLPAIRTTGETKPATPQEVGQRGTDQCCATGLSMARATSLPLWATGVVAIVNPCCDNVFCSFKLCTQLVGSIVRCYGATDGCLWNQNDCTTSADCSKYTTASAPSFSSCGLCSDIIQAGPSSWPYDSCIAGTASQTQTASLSSSITRTSTASSSGTASRTTSSSGTASATRTQVSSPSPSPGPFMLRTVAGSGVAGNGASGVSSLDAIFSLAVFVALESTGTLLVSG